MPRVIIEEDVTIAHGVILHDVHIKSRCIIGMGAILLYNVVCEEDVIVAAGSYYPKECKFRQEKLRRKPGGNNTDISDRQKFPLKKESISIVSFAENI